MVAEARMRLAGASWTGDNHVMREVGPLPFSRINHGAQNLIKALVLLTRVPDLNPSTCT